MARGAANIEVLVHDRDARNVPEGNFASVRLAGQVWKPGL
jgi:hypothetical protein